MSQSNVIFGCIFVGFIVFITMRGKLPAYLNALLGTNAAPASSGASASAAGGSPLAQAQSVAGQVQGAIGQAQALGGSISSVVGGF